MTSPNSTASDASPAMPSDLHAAILALPVPYQDDARALAQAFRNGYLHCRADAASLVASSPAAGGAPPWIAVDERMPEPGTDCLVWCTALGPGKHFAKVDRWDEQREAPVSWSSATIPVGLGWDDSDYEDVSHWQPLPPPPASDAGQQSEQGGGA
jgi:hypothetical protein